MVSELGLHVFTVGDVEHSAYHASTVRRVLQLAGVTEPTHATVRTDDPVISSGSFRAVECSREMDRHRLAIFRMNEPLPLGALHLSVTSWQAENSKELGRAICHLMLDVPFKGGDAARTLREPQHLFTVPQRVGRLSLTAFGFLAFGNRAAQEQCRGCKDAGEGLQQNQIVMDVKSSEGPCTSNGVPDRHR